MTITHSKLPWRIRIDPRDNGNRIVWAERNNPEHPYDIEVFSEDVGGPDNLYPEQQRNKDMELTVVATAVHADLVEAISEIVHAMKPQMEALHPGSATLSGLKKGIAALNKIEHVRANMVMK